MPLVAPVMTTVLSDLLMDAPRELGLQLLIGLRCRAVLPPARD